ncbi:PHP domain-containing protein [Catenovulum sp. 2E275]|uniref:PHP domain-containing protein n=1 Tax=Catenovulum sp. 2E275 TaxID=2980497 RepID=UPI0021D0541D|nr:PHP domain-containing protein [Catenovulum sp. 2E275]MCU4674790.1 PHP domain-containing protein [Catenovulum sp. 2E275]
MRFDLHSHTNCSDGELSPEELVLRAENKAIDVLAITDHDTVSAITPAKAAIKKHKLNLTLIEGVEISTSWHGFEIHIVGLNIDSNNSLLQQRLTQQIATRNLRAEKIAGKLAAIGFENCFDEVKKIAQGQSISRVHFAKYLLRAGHVSHIQQAFDKYLARRAKAYVAPMWISIEEAINWIHQAGGEAVLAHPTRYDMTNKWVKKLIEEFKLAGGDAIEAALPRQNKNELIQLVNYANQAQLKVSQGSDFHRVSPYTELGKTLDLPETCEPVWRNWTHLEQVSATINME